MTIKKKKKAEVIFDETEEIVVPKFIAEADYKPSLVSVKDAVNAEREECAKIADKFRQQDTFDSISRNTNSVAREIASLIRSRK